MLAARATTASCATDLEKCVRFRVRTRSTTARAPAAISRRMTPTAARAEISAPSAPPAMPASALMTKCSLPPEPSLFRRKSRPFACSSSAAAAAAAARPPGWRRWRLCHERYDCGHVTPGSTITLRGRHRGDSATTACGLFATPSPATPSEARVVLRQLTANGGRTSTTINGPGANGGDGGGGSCNYGTPGGVGGTDGGNGGCTYQGGTGQGGSFASALATLTKHALAAGAGGAGGTSTHSGGGGGGGVLIDGA